MDACELYSHAIGGCDALATALARLFGERSSAGDSGDVDKAAATLERYVVGIVEDGGAQERRRCILRTNRVLQEVLAPVAGAVDVLLALGACACVCACKSAAHHGNR